MTTSATPTLRIRTIPDLLAVIPRLLGFHPADSLALLVIDEGRLALTARLNLPETAQEVSDQLGRLWERYPNALYLAVAYCAEPDRAWTALAALSLSAPSGAEVRRYHADGTRWFDHADAPGEPYDITSNALAAQAAYEGLPALADREEVERLVEPTVTPRQVTRALRVLSRKGLDHDGLVRDAMALVRRADGGDTSLSLVDAALLSVASHDLAFRESAILSTSQANAEARRALWLGVVQRTVPSCAGFALVILGIAAWVSGQGALLVVCIQGAGRVASDGEWLGFLDHLNRDVVPPTDWEQLRADRYCAHLEALAGAEGPGLAPTASDDPGVR